MKFKVGDKVKLIKIPKWYGGVIKLNEECVVISINKSDSPGIVWVRNTAGLKAPIYEDWASLILKNQQLLFAFME